MRHYETVFIADPDIPLDVQEILFEKARTLITGNAGEIINFDEWGNKRLAYEIRKKQRGHYVRLDYCGTGDTVNSLENAFRIDERVLKFMTILLDQDADPEQLKAAVEAGRQPTEETPADTPAETPMEETPADTPDAEKQKSDDAEADGDAADDEKDASAEDETGGDDDK